MAQEIPTETHSQPLVVSQTSQQLELDAFFSSKYTYWDARVWALFWNEPVQDSKATIGSKLLHSGPAATQSIDGTLGQARSQALGRARQLTLFGETYTYQDAEALARFWNEPSPAEAKLRVERKLIMGDQATVTQALQQASRPPVQASFINNLVGSHWNYNYQGQALEFTFGRNQIENFSNGWWQGIRWQPVGVNQLRLQNPQSQKTMNLTFDSENSFHGADWDGSPVSGSRKANISPPVTPPPVSSPRSLTVTNLQSGELLGSSFRVNGRGIPGSQVVVQVEYPKQDFLSQLAGVMLNFQTRGTVAPDGSFSVAVDAKQVPRGEAMTITVSDSVRSPVAVFRSKKGADNQVQANQGQGPSTATEKFYDHQNHFGFDIPAGWVRVAPDSSSAFKVSNNAGTSLNVGTGPARDLSIALRDLRSELARQGNRVNSESSTRLAGLPATRLEYTDNNRQTDGQAIACVTGQNQMFVVVIETPRLNDPAADQQVRDMLNSFRINRP